MSSRALARRSPSGMRRRRRGRRNPKISWGLLAVGGIVGAGTAMASGYFINSTATPPKTTTSQTYASNAATGGAIGLALAGIGAAVMKGGSGTAIAGLIGGAALFGGVYVMNRPATTTTPPTTTA